MSDQTATEATELDKTRRYLRPVQATVISDDPDGVHLAKYEWLPMFKEWATGPGLCGESMQQGPLPEGTVVTCASCLEWKPKYERMLAPGYRAEDDDLDVLRERLVREMHRRSTHLDLLTEDHPLGPVADGVVANVRGEVLGLQSALGMALGGLVQGGDADLRSREYYKAWLAKAQPDQFRCRCVSCQRVLQLAGRGSR